jgi:DNA-nicking Smr family endonuclease
VRRASKPKAARDAAARGAETAGPAAYSYEDRVAFNQAFSGVSPLGGKSGARRQPARQSAPPRDRSATAPEPGGVDTDAVARARLDALVGGGVRFDVRRDAGWVEGERAGKNGRALRDLRQGRATPEAEIDLHRMTGDEAEHALVHFLRDEAKRGRRVVRVIHGKGLHSEGGIGVLGDRVVDAITGGSAAVHVAAFVTASMSHGGAGALLVRLVER